MNKKHIAAPLKGLGEVEEIGGEELLVKFGRTIRSFRLAFGLTPKEFADNIGCSVPYVMRLEDGRVDPEIGLVERCARALNIEISELLLAASIDAEAAPPV